MIASGRSPSFFVSSATSWSEVTGQSRGGHEPSLPVVSCNFYWLYVTIIHNFLIDLRKLKYACPNAQVIRMEFVKIFDDMAWVEFHEGR